MKKIRLVQNLLRLAVTVLVIVMLFVPVFSYKVTSLTKERVAQLTAMGLIAVEREDMTLEEFNEMMEIITPLTIEAEIIRIGITPDEEELPFDFIIHTTHPEYYVDNYHMENLDNQLYPIQSEISEAYEQEGEFSIVSLIQSLVNGGGVTLRLITTNILEEGELEDTEGLSDSEIQERIQKVAENREECGFSDSLINSLQRIGVVNSDTWVYLSKLDTTKLNEEVMNLVWFACSFTSFTVIVAVLFLIILIITLIVLVLGELARVLRKKFNEKGALTNAGLFQYCTPAILIAALAFLTTGDKIPAIVFVLLGLVVACAFFYSFTEGAAKQGKGCGIFFWGIRAVTLVCVVVCLIGTFAGLNYNAYEAAVNEDQYDLRVEKVREDRKADIDSAYSRLENAVKAYNLFDLQSHIDEDPAWIADQKAYLGEAITEAEKQVEILESELKVDYVSGIVFNIQLLKLLVFLYLFILASYLTFAVDRLGSLRSTAYPMALVKAKFVGQIVATVFAAAVEIWLFDGLVTSFAYIFAVCAILEIAVAIFQKVARKFEYEYVVTKGQALCDEGTIPAGDWSTASELLDQMQASATSLKTVAVVSSVSVLLDEYTNEDAETKISADELGRRLQNAFANPSDLRALKNASKKRR